MSGRGAWANSGLGGTLNVTGTGPGPYYVLSDGGPWVGSAGLEADATANERAVTGAVKAYQHGLHRRLDVPIKFDGQFGPRTKQLVKDFQVSVGISDWGGIGPDTSKMLLFPDLRFVVNKRRDEVGPLGDMITPVLVCGVITMESTWDAGAVGFADEHDVGLAQINAQAHPDMSEEERLQPVTSFNFVFDYMLAALRADGIEDIKDAVASYNLGIGGTRTWIRAGRPSLWTPPGSTVERDMDHYIYTIRNACKS